MTRNRKKIYLAILLGLTASSPSNLSVAGEAQELSPAERLALRDSDRDDLTDLEEWMLGTDLFNPDSDGDGLPDGLEILLLQTDPIEFTENRQIAGSLPNRYKIYLPETGRLFGEFRDHEEMTAGGSSSSGASANDPCPPTPVDEFVGMVCMQTVNLIGLGSQRCTLLYQVVNAECVPFSSASCSASGCSGTIGNTSEEVDPLCLLGG